MSLIGVLNSDENINQKITNAFSKIGDSDYLLTFLTEENTILEFLNFELPEIIIINFSDPLIEVDLIVKQVQNDAWLHSFGIIGLYDREKQSEKEILSRVKDLNVLVMLDFPRIGSHIVKSIQIITRNWQIIFQRDISSKLVNNATGSFIIKNDTLAVPVYAGIAVTNLAQRGCIDPDTKMNLQLSLAELIINGIEHGNCGISYDEKTDGLEKGLSVVELVNEKCKDPVISSKKVYFEWDIGETQTKFVIRDDGEGFDVKKYSTRLKIEDPYALHGRGILMATTLAKKLSYNMKGNQVILLIDHDQSVLKETPQGFLSEEIVFVKKGDIIFKEEEQSDFLYYISSGSFSVFHKTKQVGFLTPADIFMGEMSFLLNNARSASVRAEDNGKLVKISRKSFISVVKKFPHYGIFLSKLLARKLVRSNKKNFQLRRQLSKKG